MRICIEMFAGTGHPMADEAAALAVDAVRALEDEREGRESSFGAEGS